jgi:hypothetical protein
MCQTVKSADGTEYIVGGAPVELAMINTPGRMYYLPDTEKFVVWTGKPHEVNNNVHVCELGSGNTYWACNSRIRHLFELV